MADLAAEPMFMLSAAYHFALGVTVEWSEGWNGWIKSELKNELDPMHRVVHEPFTEATGVFNNWRYVPYKVYGWEALERSKFRFCQYDAFSERDHSENHSALMGYLAAATIYPRQLEMLMKMGLRRLVEDLIWSKRKNKEILDWAQTDPCKAFGLDKVELRAFMEFKKPELIPHYKRLKKARLNTSFAVLDELDRQLADMKSFVQLCRRHKVKPERVKRYLDSFTGPRCHGGYFGLQSAYNLWRDYLSMALWLGYDTKINNVFFPPNLDLAHNEASVEQVRRMEASDPEKAKQRAEREKMLERRKLKYNFAYGDHFIRVAENEAEIVNEGRTLEHCVAGYAGRHMEGKITILFLRRIATPGASLYTIEMHGNRLIQIHGYKNERSKGIRIAPDPQETMIEMLDVWLDWLSRGSPRDKGGTPKYRKAKEANAA